MAIVGKSLKKGLVQSVAGTAVHIYQVPVNKKALIKHFHFYVDASTMLAGEDAWIVITDSSDTELVKLWWTTDANAIPIAASDTDFIFLTTKDTDSHENIILESEQKIRLHNASGTAKDFDIRVDISGAEEDA